MLRGDAAVDRADAEVDLRFHALVVVVPSDQCGVFIQADSAFREELRELDCLGALPGEDALMELAMRPVLRYWLVARAVPVRAVPNRVRTLRRSGR